MIPARAVGILFMLAGLAPGGRESRPVSLKVEAKAESARATCSEDGLTYSSILSLRIRVINSSTATLILAKQFEAAPWYKLAASMDDARQSKFRQELSGDEYWPGDSQAPKFGGEPDEARFELLAPTAAAERVVDVWVLSTDVPGGIHGFASAGASYVLLTGIRTWPHLSMSEKATQAVVRRWHSRGTLVVDDFETPFVPITIPPPNGRCGVKDSGGPDR